MNNDIGSKIRRYRTERGLTQQNLATDINYSDKVISKWERGESVPDAGAIKILAEYFDITIDELLDDKSRNEISVPFQKTFQISDYKLPLVCLQCIVLMLTILFVVETFVIIADYSIPILIFAEILAVSFFAISLLDTIFVYVKSSRLLIYISFLVLSFIALIGGIISYIEYGADPQYIILNPNVIVKLALCSLGVIFINFFIQNAFKQKNVETSSGETSNKSSSIGLFLHILNIVFLILIYISFVFYTIDYYAVIAIHPLFNTITSAINNKANLFEFFFSFDSTYDSALVIITVVILMLVTIWDLVMAIYYFIAIGLKNSNKFYESIARPIIMIVSSILLLFFFFFSLFTFFNQSGDGYISFRIDPLFGVYCASVCIILFAVVRIINAIMILRKKV